MQGASVWVPSIQEARMMHVKNMAEARKWQGALKHEDPEPKVKKERAPREPWPVCGSCKQKTSGDNPPIYLDGGAVTWCEKCWWEVP